MVDGAGDRSVTGITAGSSSILVDVSITMT
jgi:hypothetical protein